jgi:hypothetical protein
VEPDVTRRPREVTQSAPQCSPPSGSITPAPAPGNRPTDGHGCQLRASPGVGQGVSLPADFGFHPERSDQGTFPPTKGPCSPNVCIIRD